jgi:hypothetical protein
MWYYRAILFVEEEEMSYFRYLALLAVFSSFVAMLTGVVLSLCGVNEDIAMGWTIGSMLIVVVLGSLPLLIKYLIKILRQ